jgi:hypothetical protein
MPTECQISLRFGRRTNLRVKRIWLAWRQRVKASQKLNRFRGLQSSKMANLRGIGADAMKAKQHRQRGKPGIADLGLVRIGSHARDLTRDRSEATTSGERGATWVTLGISILCIRPLAVRLKPATFVAWQRQTPSLLGVCKLLSHASILTHN